MSDITYGKECIGSPEVVIEGESAVYSFTYPAAITIDANSFMYAYRGSSDVSATVLAGSLSGDGSTTLTLKTISGETGASNGAEYVYTFAVTCQGLRKVYYFRRIVLRKSLR
jgi:hypothetical protein